MRLVRASWTTSSPRPLSTALAGQSSKPNRLSERNLGRHRQLKPVDHQGWARIGEGLLQGTFELFGCLHPTAEEAHDFGHLSKTGFKRSVANSKRSRSFNLRVHSPLGTTTFPRSCTLQPQLLCDRSCRPVNASIHLRPSNLGRPALRPPARPEVTSTPLNRDLAGGWTAAGLLVAGAALATIALMWTVVKANLGDSGSARPQVSALRPRGVQPLPIRCDPPPDSPSNRPPLLNTHSHRSEQALRRTSPLQPTVHHGPHAMRREWSSVSETAHRQPRTAHRHLRLPQSKSPSSKH